ncbi:hypothetical protein PENTCL1PPCAC_4580, partial [Pristionchus entomophagus]
GCITPIFSDVRAECPLNYALYSEGKDARGNATCIDDKWKNTLFSVPGGYKVYCRPTAVATTTMTSTTTKPSCALLTHNPDYPPGCGADCISPVFTPTYTTCLSGYELHFGNNAVGNLHCLDGLSWTGVKD